jgi:hypothetical protein
MVRTAPQEGAEALLVKARQRLANEPDAEEDRTEYCHWTYKYGQVLKTLKRVYEATGRKEKALALEPEIATTQMKGDAAMPESTREMNRQLDQIRQIKNSGQPQVPKEYREVFGERN